MHRSSLLTLNFFTDFEPGHLDLNKLNWFKLFLQAQLQQKKRTHWAQKTEYRFIGSLTPLSHPEEIRMEFSHPVRYREVLREDLEHPRTYIKEQYFDVINTDDRCGEGAQAHLYGLLGFFYLNPAGQLSFIRHHPAVIKLFDIAEHFNKKFIKREAKLLQRLPYIKGKPAQFTAKKEGQAVFASITMRRVPGVTLSDLLCGNNLLTTDQRLLIAWRAARGLSYLHAKKIVHRDIKLENILVDDFFWPRLVDLGLAIRLDKVKVACLGSLLHLPPEAVTSEYALNEWSDVYSYATVLSRLLGSKGRPPKDRFIFAELRQGREPDTFAGLFSICLDLNEMQKRALKELIERMERVSQPKRCTLPECENELQRIYHERLLLQYDAPLREELKAILLLAQGLRAHLQCSTAWSFSQRWQSIPHFFKDALAPMDTKPHQVFSLFLQAIDLIFLNKTLTRNEVLDLIQEESRHLLEYDQKLNVYLERLSYISRVLYGSTSSHQYELLKRKLSLLLSKGERLKARINEVNILMDDIFLLRRKWGNKLESFGASLRSLIDELQEQPGLALVREFNDIFNRLAHRGEGDYGDRLRAVMRQYIANALTEAAVQSRTSVASRHRLNEIQRILQLIESAHYDAIDAEIGSMRNQLFGTLPAALAAVRPSVLGAAKSI